MNVQGGKLKAWGRHDETNDSVDIIDTGVHNHQRRRKIVCCAIDASVRVVCVRTMIAVAIMPAPRKPTFNEGMAPLLVSSSTMTQCFSLAW